MSLENIDKANKKFNHPNVTYLHGDVLDVLPDDRYDVVVLSNVLEHLVDRPPFLRKIVQTVKPRRFLIRVPLMKELAVDWPLDPTHEIEYTKEKFAKEIFEADMTIFHSEIYCGEIWAVVLPSHSVDHV